MLDALLLFLIAMFTAVVMARLSWVIRHAKPAALSEQKGAIMPERWSAWLTVIGGVLMIMLALWISLYSNGGWVAAALALIGAVIAGFMAPSVTSIHAVYWNAYGVEGPAKTYGPTLSTARTEIAWRDIIGAGKTITGYWYVESENGRRIYWSFLYRGYGALTVALRSHCPSLQLPSDLT